MKKIFSLALCLMLLALCFTATAFAENEEPEDFTRIVAMGMDPYGVITLDEAIDPDTAKWAAIYYRLNTPLDSKGIGYIGQFFVCPAAEPHIVIEYDTSTAGEWKKVVVDMTTVGVPGMDSKWNSATEGADFSSIRFDPMEINRNDPVYGGDVLEGAHVQEGDNIDIAWIAFFTTEEDAKEFDGTQGTCVSYIDATMVYDMTNESGTLLTFSKDELEEEDESSKETEESTEASAEESKAEESKADASTDESKAASENAPAETTSSEAGNDGGNGPNVGLIIGIIVAVVAVAVIVVVIIKKKK